MPSEETHQPSSTGNNGRYDDEDDDDGGFLQSLPPPPPPLQFENVTLSDGRGINGSRCLQPQSTNGASRSGGGGGTSGGSGSDGGNNSTGLHEPLVGILKKSK